MKRIFLAVILFLSATAHPSGAYTTDSVYITFDADVDSKGLSSLLTTEIFEPMKEQFKCLKIQTLDGVTALLDLGRQQQLLGTPEEQQVKLEDIGGAVGAKYLIAITTRHLHNPEQWTVKLVGMNTRKAQAYYRDFRTFSSASEAIDAAQSMAQRLIKETMPLLAGGSRKREVCPYTGRVDITVETKRLQQQRTNMYYACDGEDKEGEKFQSQSATGRQQWKLKRIGNPDTAGTVEATIEEEFVAGEQDMCYTCRSGAVGERRWWTINTAAKSVNGLSDTSRGAEIDNKDSTVRLNFNDDNTFTIAVRAVSGKGRIKKSHQEKAEGVCDLKNVNKSEEGTFTLPLEYTFGPFPGTLFDEKLTGRNEFRVYHKEIEEENIYTIDFDLSLPTTRN